jgi:hypothetical protein
MNLVESAQHLLDNPADLCNVADLASKTFRAIYRNHTEEHLHISLELQKKWLRQIKSAQRIIHRTNGLDYAVLFDIKCVNVAVNSLNMTHTNVCLPSSLSRKKEQYWFIEVLYLESIGDAAMQNPKVAMDVVTEIDRFLCKEELFWQTAFAGLNVLQRIMTHNKDDEVLAVAKKFECFFIPRRFWREDKSRHVREKAKLFNSRFAN